MMHVKKTSVGTDETRYITRTLTLRSAELMPTVYFTTKKGDEGKVYDENNTNCELQLRCRVCTIDADEDQL